MRPIKALYMNGFDAASARYDFNNGWAFDWSNACPLPSDIRNVAERGNAIWFLLPNDQLVRVKARAA